MRLVLVSENAHKARELADALPGWKVEPWKGPKLPPETGDSFAANARAKAAFGREHHPRAWVAGEDSGLVVATLGGAPGIFSARYAGEGASDEANVAKLLDELADAANRRARYVSELIVLAPDGTETAVKGTLDGSIAAAPVGDAGFGYDPVFVPAGGWGTVAELGDEWKAEHSHRALAARALADALGAKAQER